MSSQPPPRSSASSPANKRAPDVDDGSEDQRSPFTRPGFILAAAVVTAIAVAGVVIAIVGGNHPAHPAADKSLPTVASSVARSTDPATLAPTRPAGPSPSVCGLTGTVLSGTVTAPPTTTWRYQGVTAYPTSPTYGPGKTASAGYRYCFQHSPTGAVFAGASAITNAFAQASKSASAVNAWIDYFAGAGPYRKQFLAQQGGSGSTPPAGEQVAITGFRLLSYTASTATVAIAVSLAGGGHSGLDSFTYALSWQNGDWKIDADTPQAFSSGPLTNLTNYIPWAAR